MKTRRQRIQEALDVIESSEFRLTSTSRQTLWLECYEDVSEELCKLWDLLDAYNKRRGHLADDPCQCLMCARENYDEERCEDKPDTEVVRLVGGDVY